VIGLIAWQRRESKVNDKRKVKSRKRELVKVLSRVFPDKFFISGVIKLSSNFGF